MPDRTSLILHIALPVPVRHHFDYLAGDDFPEENLQPGMRVMVPFRNRQQRVGIILGTSRSTDIIPQKLKKILQIVDHKPLFDRSHLALLEWASDYYHYPPGEVLFSTLPGLLRKQRPAGLKTGYRWRLTATGREYDFDAAARARKQSALIRLLHSYPEGLGPVELNRLCPGWRNAMKSLLEKGLVERISGIQPPPADIRDGVDICFGEEQAQALGQILPRLSSSNRFLLDGVTGSGKTEIYLEAVRQVISVGRQVLILVPEIGLTPHFVSRLEERLRTRPVVLHSRLTDGERLQSWLQAREGIASVVRGTRSAVWTPLKRPGLLIVDEEHDLSYKQQEGFRYSARDIAVLRASRLNIPVILGSATPSLESLRNAGNGKLDHITLTKRAENARLPRFRIIDLRRHKTNGLLSSPLVNAIRKVLDEGHQTLLFLNRRGYSPVLMCDSCNWIVMCLRCNLPVTYHKSCNLLICHHCGRQIIPPANCQECANGAMIQIGHGTERLTETLQELFPSARILRIDRDSTRKKQAMENYFELIRTGQADILIGTQMLAKGHHFPDVTLAGILDADRGLYSADFRASERMGQLVMQVSGRAGRAGKPGTVMIQTHFPEHPFLNSLLNHGYSTFARLLLAEREAANLPPYTYIALLRAESYDEKAPVHFLHDARSLLQKNSPPVEMSGPFPAPIEKRAGKFRFQLLLQSGSRQILQKVISPWVRELECLKSNRRVRWSLDVDPQEIL